MLESDLPAFLKPGNKVVIFEKQTHLLNRIKTPQAETKVYAKKMRKQEHYKVVIAMQDC